MIIAKLDPDRFLHLVRNELLIAFQRVEFGYAIAAPCEAYYAPMGHPGGGNLNNDNNKELGGGFELRLGHAFIFRMSTPALRTLRPTAKPIPTHALVHYLQSAFGVGPETMSMYPKAAGDHATVIESECQVVIQAIEEHQEPGLKDAMRPAKREALSDALDLVIQNAESARELCEVGEDKPQLVKMYLLQSSTAMKSALEMLLQP
jgi:hypothetical protein